MPKYYKKRSYSGKRDKYSVETYCGALNIPGTSGANLQVVAPSSTEGMRKVKHLTLSLASADTSAGGLSSVYWALVYVPSGTTPSVLNVSGGSMYEPSQFVMSAGVADFKAGPVRIHSPVSRNLNAGDTIYLVCWNNYGAASHVYLTVRYAITLQ